MHIENYEEFTACINGETTITPGMNESICARATATDLRKAARLAGFAGHFASNGDRAVLTSLLTAQTQPGDWAIDGSGNWVRNPAGAAPSAPSAPQTTGSIASDIERMLASAAGQSVRSEVERVLAEKDIVRPIVINRPDRAPVTVGGDSHKMLPDILKSDSMQEATDRNYLLFGPTGTGKSVLAKSFADAMGLDYAEINCTRGMSETGIKGRVNPLAKPGAQDAYAESEFIRIWTHGGVFAMDELDAAHANVLVTLNGGLSGGRINIELAGISRERHPDTVIFGIMNTTGDGATASYTARSALDASTLNRFDMRAWYVDYDKGLERRIVSAYLNDAGRTAKACDSIWAVRSAVQSAGLERHITTRTVKQIALHLSHGISWDSCLDRLTALWAEDESAKVQAYKGATI